MSTDYIHKTQNNSYQYENTEHMMDRNKNFPSLILRDSHLESVEMQIHLYTYSLQQWVHGDGRWLLGGQNRETPQFDSVLRPADIYEINRFQMVSSTTEHGYFWRVVTLMISVQYTTASSFRTSQCHTHWRNTSCSRRQVMTSNSRLQHSQTSVCTYVPRMFSSKTR